MTERDVVRLATVITALGLITGCLISAASLATVILVWLVGFLYNWRFKRTGLVGNLMVSFSAGMTFVYGGIVAGRPFEPIVWFFAVLALLINLGEEVAADTMDVAGDRLAHFPLPGRTAGGRKRLEDQRRNISGSHRDKLPAVSDWLAGMILPGSCFAHGRGNFVRNPQAAGRFFGQPAHLYSLDIPQRHSCVNYHYPRQDREVKT